MRLEWNEATLFERRLSRLMKRFAVVVASLLFAGSALSAGFHFSKQSLLQELTAEGRVATGLRVAGEPVPADGELLEFVEARAAQTLDLPVELVLDGQSLGSMTLRELGGSVCWCWRWCAGQPLRLSGDSRSGGARELPC